jgi:hypothetical protein
LRKIFIFVVALFVVALAAPSLKAAAAADSTDIDVDGEVPEHLRYYKEKYEASYREPFEIVWKAIKQSLADFPCAIQTQVSKQNDNGLYKAQ